MHDEGGCIMDSEGESTGATLSKAAMMDQMERSQIKRE